jgi:signal transduction histidine kinase
MKNKIALKLGIYFAIAILVFATIISSVFIILFRNNTVELHKTELKERAVKISQTLSSIMSSNVTKGQGNGYGAYIRFLNDIAMADVWIVDENLEIITNGLGTHAQVVYSQLPTGASEIVKEGFKGETSFSENFSSFLETPTLTIGTPIKNSQGVIIGVVLLHSPVNGIDTAVSKGMYILVLSIGVALIIAILLSMGFSIMFTKPLNIMSNTAIKLAKGDYTAQNNIFQNDEIGTLAKNLDILAHRLDLSSKESEKLQKLRQDFVANISHELRTPITVIRGSLEALDDEVVTEPSQVKEYYKQMLNESKGLQRLVGDLLDLSRLQNMDFNIEMSALNLCDVVSDVVRSAKRIGETKQIEFIVENNAKSCNINGDYVRLKQMLMTIVDNAIKFSSNNGHIFITLSQDESLRVSIKDEGVGMAKEDLPYIFDRFYKTKAIENTDGTGLGLAIAKQIAVRHNAEIQVNSDIGEGSEFIIKFN